MAIDQTKPPIPTDDLSAPAIENEIAAYRAISPAAILSLVLGMVSVFCYADVTFLLVAAASVVFGVLAHRKIRRLPEILTGRKFATAGIILGTFFAATSLTRTVSNYVVLRIQAQQFGNAYAQALQSRSFETCAWYLQNPEYRKGKTPQAITDELRKQGGASKGRPNVFEEKTAGLQSAIKRLGEEGQKVSYQGIESNADSGLETFANLLFEIDGPAPKEGQPKTQYMLVETRRSAGSGPLDWEVRSVIYPYTRASARASAPVQDDDGHGHGGGAH